MIRKLDQISVVVAVATLAQLILGTVYVTRAYASKPATPATQQQAVDLQRQFDRATYLEARLAVLEKLDVGARIAVLEHMNARMEKIEFLAYGQIISIGGVLILGLLQVKAQRNRRSEP